MRIYPVIDYTEETADAEGALKDPWQRIQHISFSQVQFENMGGCNHEQFIAGSSDLNVLPRQGRMSRRQNVAFEPLDRSRTRRLRYERDTARSEVSTAVDPQLFLKPADVCVSPQSRAVCADNVKARSNGSLKSKKKRSKRCRGSSTRTRPLRSDLPMKLASSSLSGLKTLHAETMANNVLAGSPLTTASAPDTPQIASRSGSPPMRTAACRVLGFGALMPPQRDIDEGATRGLLNLGGGSCFLNVVLQCLANLPPLRNFYLYYNVFLPERELLCRQYEIYTRDLETTEQIPRRLKRGPHKFIKRAVEHTSVTWELALLINHMWRSPSGVKVLKPDALYQACSRIMPAFDPRQMQDSDEFLRLLLDFLDAELRAAAGRISIRVALQQVPPLSLVAGRQQISSKKNRSEYTSAANHFFRCDGISEHENDSSTSEADNFARQTLFSALFEGAEVDFVRCAVCGSGTSTFSPFKALAIAMTNAAQCQAFEFAHHRAKLTSFFGKLTEVDLVECLDRHFADDCDSLKRATGEGYFCENCGSKQDAIKSCKLVENHLPFFLCLTLKRFVTGRATYKIWNPVGFSALLDLQPYVVAAEDVNNSIRRPRRSASIHQTVGSSHFNYSVNFFDTQDAQLGRHLSKDQNTTYGLDPKATYGSDGAQPLLDFKGNINSPYLYRLVGVVEHEGPATDQGHYVCYFFHAHLKGWFRANDKEVIPVKRNQVLKASPYMLFYERIVTNVDIVGSFSAVSPETHTGEVVVDPALSGSEQPSDESKIIYVKGTFEKRLVNQLRLMEDLKKGRWPQWEACLRTVKDDSSLAEGMDA